jgi:hypothetical protein
MLAPVGVRNDDSRRLRFAENALDSRTLPIPFLWQREESSDGHDGSVIVATVDSITYGEQVTGSGEILEAPLGSKLAEDVEEFVLLAEKGVIGASIRMEPDSMEMMIVEAGTDEPVDLSTLTEEEFEEIELEVLCTHATIMNAAAVSGPAFGETLGTIEIFDDAEDDDEDMSDQAVENALVGSVIGSTGLPVGDRSRTWDGSGATKRMLGVGAETARRGHLYRDPEGDADSASTYKLPFADVVDGTLTLIPKGVAAAAGGRGVNAASIPESEKATIRGKICRMYGRIRSKYDDWPECPFSASENSVKQMGLVASERSLPNHEWFKNPELTEPTAVTYGDDGRIFGHMALHGTCHVGVQQRLGICTTPPDTEVDFSWFHRYAIETDEGTVWAGRFTAGGWHASLDKSLSAAMAAYDDKTVAGYVVVGKDDHGFWIAGALQPDLDSATLNILSRRKISGDWRETPDGLELIEVLALQKGPAHLSEPGFPIMTHTSFGRTTALVACFSPEPPDTEELSVDVLEIDYDRIAQTVIEKMRDAEKAELRRAELVAAIDETVAVERDARLADLRELVGG